MTACIDQLMLLADLIVNITAIISDYFTCVMHMAVVCRLVRLDYDVAVGVPASAAKNTALSQTTQTTEPMPYDDSHQFAVRMFAPFPRTPRFYLFFFLKMLLATRSLLSRLHFHFNPVDLYSGGSKKFEKDGGGRQCIRPVIMPFIREKVAL